MRINKLFIILMVFIFINIAVVSADDLNSTEEVIHLNESSQVNLTEVNNTVVKTTPLISIETDNLKSKDSFNIYLKNSSNSPLKSKKLTIQLNNEKYSLNTNSYGAVKLNINLPAKKYKLSVSFDGDEEYNSVSKNFNLKISKIKTKITSSANYVSKNNNLYFYLIDNDGNSISSKKITFKFNGKTFTKKTNSKGRVAVKFKLSKSKYLIKAKFSSDNQYKSSSKKLVFYVVNPFNIKIGNSKLLSKGYLRIYFSYPNHPISKKTIKLIIGNKKLSKKTNSEGIVIFKSNVKSHHYTIKAQIGKYYSSKNIKCYDIKVKDPLKEKISSKKGIPDVDLMPGNYVMGSDSTKYTLTKKQYREVLKRDSHCLFLNNKLTKYTFFKTKSHPNLNHIIKREKWNVIEREINKKLVNANKHNYWPSEITVSLKGKSYVYPEVRDVQNTGYTCGPTAGSVCSQVLKNYVCEKYLAKLGGTTKKDGTKCSGIKKALEKNNFICQYYYKASFKDALNELKKGGAALVFHARNHYVTIIDISSDGRKVLVSNSYGSYDNIPTKWLKVSYMKNKFFHWDDSLIVKLDYKLSDSTKNSINAYYASFGSNWHRHSTHQTIGKS